MAWFLSRLIVSTAITSTAWAVLALILILAFEWLWLPNQNMRLSVALFQTNDAMRFVNIAMHTPYFLWCIAVASACIILYQIFLLWVFVALMGHED